MRSLAPLLALFLVLAAFGCAKQPQVQQPEKPASEQQAEPETTGAEPHILYVSEQGARLYSQPGSFKTSLDALPRGEVVLWIEDRRDMVRVKVVRTGEKGWLKASQLSKKPLRAKAKPDAQERKPPPPPPPAAEEQGEPKFILTF